MKTILEEIQKKLNTHFPYVDENWGQLNLPNPPVRYPCALIDCDNAAFSNNSNDWRQTPNLRQEAVINIEITVGLMRLTNTSSNAPLIQKNTTWKIYEHISKAHEALQGQVVGNGKLIRVNQKRVRRADGMQEHRIIYTLIAHDC